MKHIVLFKLVERTCENQDKLSEILNSMKDKIDFVNDLQVHKDFLGSDRSYDVMLEVTLEDHDLERYANDPYHVACKQRFAPMITNSITIDYK
ncbi:MAG: Dabb family protein [Erysipelotrichaceae bacterium]|nr:Dabb family protein [Erysipelotrichaceae bacterium]MDY5251574.1 Dabb family protein [Erysipelotrichaceae bacterium]